MERRELTLEEIHEGTLEILKKIISICDELHINYYMAYGSLLGVIRHSGFIPWDDDCDIIMMRPDYDKFIEYCIENEELIAPFKILTRKNCKGYPYNIARFNDMRYIAVYENMPQYDSGMFIDIYPLDGAGNSIKKVKKKFKIKKKLLFRAQYWATQVRYKPSEGEKKWIIFLKRVVRKGAKVVGAPFFLNQLELLGKTYAFEDCKYISLLIWSEKLVIQYKEDYSEYIIKDFEGISVKIPKGYDRILSSCYGNYMELPPVEKRKTTHGYKLYIRKLSEIKNEN